MYRKVALELSSKPTKYELQGPYGDPVYELPGARSGRNNYQGTSGTDMHLHCTLAAVWQFSKKKNAHEPARRKSSRAHTL